MGLESATYIQGLNASNPVGATDSRRQGDDHIRLLKAVLLATFPDATQAYAEASQAQAEDDTSVIPYIFTPQRVFQAVAAAYATPSQAEAEDDADTDRYFWTPQRVHQAVAAYLAANPVGLTQAAIVADTNTALALNTEYYDPSTAGVVHTLPDQATASEGDQVVVTASAAAATGAKVITKHANDSSTPMTVLCTKHDFAHFIFKNSQWMVKDERSSVVVRLAKTADLSLNDASNTAAFSTSTTVDLDTTGGQWDNATNHRFDVPSNWPSGHYGIYFTQVSSGSGVCMFPSVSGTDVVDPSDSQSNDGAFPNIPVAAGQNISLIAYANSSARTLHGNAGKTQTRATIKLERWVR